MSYFHILSRTQIVYVVCAGVCLCVRNLLTHNTGISIYAIRWLWLKFWAMPSPDPSSNIWAARMWLFSPDGLTDVATLESFTVVIAYAHAKSHATNVWRTKNRLFYTIDLTRRSSARFTFPNQTKPFFFGGGESFFVGSRNFQPFSF